MLANNLMQPKPYSVLLANHVVLLLPVRVGNHVFNGRVPSITDYFFVASHLNRPNFDRIYDNYTFPEDDFSSADNSNASLVALYCS